MKMKQNKYITVFSLFDFNKTRKKRISWLVYTFIIIFFVYIVSSLLIACSDDRHVIGILTVTGELLSLAASILISIIAIRISDLYNDEVMNLLNNIKEANQPLMEESAEQSMKINIIKVSFFIVLLLICGFFLIITFIQMVGLYLNLVSSFDDTIRNLALVVDVLMILLNILSIWDCVKSSNEYKHTIVEIEKINDKIFDKYNKNVVEHSKR